MLKLAAFAASIGLFATAAAEIAPVVTGHASTRLLPEVSAAQPGATLWLALDQTLDPGWHVYWKNPGDSGLPLDLGWRLPAGFSAGEPLYPLPEQIKIGPLANFGHSNAATFLIPISVPESISARTVEIGLKATWLICEEICVPEEGAFSLTIPVAAAAEPHPQGAPIVEAARKTLPAPLDATFVAGSGGVTLEAGLNEDFARAFFFPEADGLIEPSADQDVVQAGGKIRIETKAGFAYNPDALENVKGVLVFETQAGERFGRAIDAGPRRDAGASRAPRPPGGAIEGGFAGFLIAAFFGGMLLNIMPCVFPVLFIKAASLAKGAGASAAIARRDGLLYAAGVLATFAALGGLLLALRAGGEALGWGFHLQSPAVVLFSVYVLFLVGLNLAGVFSVGASLQNVGSAAAAKGGPLSAFATGALAVFVAAPCIGPLLSAPMGAAATLPAASGMAIYLALAAGFALPFTALSTFPRLAGFLPKPGPWMSTFKLVLAFPVFAGAAFFLWVLTEQTGTAGLARALAGGLLLAFAAVMFERSKSGPALSLSRAASIAALALALFGSSGLTVVNVATAKDRSYGGLTAVAFDPETIAELRAAGRGVFVDFTAAWCVTCQVNKLTVLSKRSLAAAFAQEDVVLMSADWTRRDPVITEALAQFGANGVPLYVYYPPAGEPSVLAQPLTEQTIIDVIRNSALRRQS
jgi:thiol:disulfide interchange protein DsbD